MDEIVEKYRTKNANAEKKLFRELNKSYKLIEQELSRELLDILSSATGTPAQIIESQRIRSLLQQIRREIQAYATTVIGPAVSESLVQASLWGAAQAHELLQSVLPETIPLIQLPDGAINQLVRNFTNGPTGRLLNSFGDIAAVRARRDLLVGLTLGHNPTKIARQLRTSLGITQQRAFLIARTETMRAQRESLRLAYKQSGNAQAWVWHAATSKRTCAACWAMHGREFSLETPMGAHPACRCSMVPKTRTLPANRTDSSSPAGSVPMGETVFSEQPESIQRTVLGDKQFERYKNGDVTLNDFVYQRSSQWGTTFTKRIPS